MKTYMSRTNFDEYFALRLNYLQVIFLFHSRVILMKQNDVKNVKKCLQSA